MILHTLIYRFADSVSDEDRDEFLYSLRELVLSSDLITGFDCKPHHLLPVDEFSNGMTGTTIAQYACEDLQTLRKFSEQPHVHEFISHWRSQISYESAYVNHEEMTTLQHFQGGTRMRHTEHTVTIDAPAALVWDVVVDVKGYADIFPPTQDVSILEESPQHQLVRLTVDVSGETLSWVSRRDIDHDRRIVAYNQLELAPLIGHMGGEWRALAIDENSTQLVLTHDFRPKDAVDGKVLGKYTLKEADDMLCAAVERNSVADLGAVKQEAERRNAGKALGE